MTLYTHPWTYKIYYPGCLLKGSGIGVVAKVVVLVVAATAVVVVAGVVEVLDGKDVVASEPVDDNAGVWLISAEVSEEGNVCADVVVV